MKKLWIVLAVFMVFFCSFAFSQMMMEEQEQPMNCMQQMGMQGMMMGPGGGCPMCEAMMSGGAKKRGGINYLLMNRDRFELNNSQVQQLRQMRNDMVRRSSEIQTRLRVARFELADMMDADEVNMSAVEKKIREIAGLEADLKVLMIRGHVESMNVLTPEQRESVMMMLNPQMMHQMHKEQMQQQQKR